MGSYYRQRSSHMVDLKGKGILYEDDDTPIKLTDQDDTLIVNEFSLSLIGKILNPKKQNFEKLLQKMPSQWGMADRITANDLGNGKFLINFTSEEDLSFVLRQGPFHFNFCVFGLVRWEPIVHDDYPWIIPFKVQVIGIPLHLWTDKNLRNIGARLGHVHVDTLDVAEGRMLVDVDTRRPLKFSRKVETKDGDEVTIKIKYEMLFKHCSTCGMLTHEKDNCPSVSDMRSRLQPHTERPGIFTRMQLPQEQSQRHNSHNDHRANALSRYGQHMETSTRNSVSSGYGEDDRKYAQRKPYSGEIQGTHADRIVRRHSDLSRSNRYGGSRASKGPYDRHQKQNWQAKVESTKHTVPSVHSREIVPYEQTSPIRNNGLNGSNGQQGLRSGEVNTAKRRASIIVTPSRGDHDMDENVTKRAKGLTQSLSFTSLSDQEPVTTVGDNQIIAALNDMDIEDQQEDGVMEFEAPDEDFLGLDLKEMEDTAAQHVASMKTTCHDVKALKISKQGTKANVPLGFQSKKIEILHRGTPRKSSSSSQGVHKTRDASRSRRHYQSSKKQRGSSSKGLMPKIEEVSSTTDI
ncbi:hypothetical protein Bca52824_082995 [Brassica carinata]|uniref:DUF4283 domain-containing protein n=1 Tax=Brassica carinata TaxID=52824 RepID=A0A8X7PI99_BRACI|nr:hypothetical protein Bca52824_082995 [Brassica carinata]